MSHGRCRCGAYGDGFRTSDGYKTIPNRPKKAGLVAYAPTLLVCFVCCGSEENCAAGRCVSLGFWMQFIPGRCVIAFVGWSRAFVALVSGHAHREEA